MKKILYILFLFLIIISFKSYSQSGSIDVRFDPTDSIVHYDDVFRQAIHNFLPIAVQSNGKVIVYRGTKIVRLDTDGSIDKDFHSEIGPNKEVFLIVVGDNDEILAGGRFTSWNKKEKNYIARLHPDGRLDTTFNCGIGPNEIVRAITVQKDGKIIIGGEFSTVNKIARNRIARLHVDGSLDLDFDPGKGPDKDLSCMAIQGNGKILIDGFFNSYNETERNAVTRINSDGSLDKDFNPGKGIRGSVKAMAVQKDGKILIAGNFSSFNGLLIKNIARLNTDGTLDTSFHQETGTDKAIETIAIQKDGKILAGGFFTSYNGITRSGIIRLNTDGSLDPGFNPGIADYEMRNQIQDKKMYINQKVRSLVIQKDGNILMGGLIGINNGKGKFFLVRLNN
jgi:uncharacterized delta-60 repeat protein